MILDFEKFQKSYSLEMHIVHFSQLEEYKKSTNFDLKFISSELFFIPGRIVLAAWHL